MNAMWIVYLADVVGGISILFATTGLLIFFGTFIAVVDLAEQKKTGIGKVLTLGGLAAFFFLTVSALIPSKQTVYLMAAAKVSQDIVESQDAKLIGDKMLTVINQELDALIERRKK